MKMKLLNILGRLALGFVTLAVTTSTATGAAPGKNSHEMKSIVVYFSHSGNTALAAQELARETGSAIVRIQPSEPYSAADLDWENPQSRCTQEHLVTTMRPAIRPLGVDFSQYDTVYIGFPIWWHEEPAVIKTFIESSDLSGKKLYPFCTSYESTMSEADEALQKAYPGLNWHTGLRFPASQAEIAEWLRH